MNLCAASNAGSVASPEPQAREAALPKAWRQRPAGSGNPVQRCTTALFKEVLNGDYIVQGFRNADIRGALFGPTDVTGQRRLSARITRQFNKLNARGLIAKIPRSRRWRVTQKGWRVLGPLVEAYA